MIRQTLVNDDYNGVFIGGMHETSAGCFKSSNNGPGEFFATFAINQVGSAVTLAMTVQGGETCNFVGTFSQYGQMGAIGGTFSCTSGEVGAFQMFEMQTSLSGMTGRFAANSSNFGCQDSGWFGGARHQ